MHFSKDPDRKIAFVWAPKCACTSLNIYFRRLRTGNANIKNPSRAPMKNTLRRIIFKCAYKSMEFMGEHKGRRTLMDAIYENKDWWDMRRQQSLFRYYYMLLFVKILRTVFPRTAKKVTNFHFNHFYDHEDYTKILFIRNPYKRIVSGFLDKYVKLKPPHEKPNFKLEIDNLNFEKFVDELDQNMCKNIDTQHFLPQTGVTVRMTMKFHKIYDIEDIDYDLIAELFGKNSKDYPFPKANISRYSTTFTGEAYKLTLDELRKIGDYPPYNLFYNEDIKAKMRRFYADDFEFFEKHGFKYDIEPA